MILKRKFVNSPKKRRFFHGSQRIPQESQKRIPSIFQKESCCCNGSRQLSIYKCRRSSFGYFHFMNNINEIIRNKHRNIKRSLTSKCQKNPQRIPVNQSSIGGDFNGRSMEKAKHRISFLMDSLDC